MKPTIILLSLAFAAPALAQDPAPRDEPVTEHTFTDASDVEGGRNTAWGDRLLSIHRLPRRLLVRPRTHFYPELLKSVEDH